MDRAARILRHDPTHFGGNTATATPSGARDVHMIDRSARQRNSSPIPNTARDTASRNHAVRNIPARNPRPNTQPWTWAIKDQRDTKDDKKFHDNHEHPVELACREITHRKNTAPALIGKISGPAAQRQPLSRQKTTKTG